MQPVLTDRLDAVWREPMDTRTIAIIALVIAVIIALFVFVI